MVNPFVWFFYKVAPYTCKIPMMNNYEDVIETEERIKDMEKRYQEYVKDEDPFYHEYLASFSASNIKQAKNLIGFIITAWYLQVIMLICSSIAVIGLISDLF